MNNSLTCNVRRVKRGLLNIGGDILHELFGVARDGDISDVRNAMNALLMEAKSLRANEVKINNIIMKSLRMLKNYRDA